MTNTTILSEIELTTAVLYILVHRLGGKVVITEADIDIFSKSYAIVERGYVGAVEFELITRPNFN